MVEHKNPFYVLLIGSDSRKGTALYTGKASDHAQLDQHADVITLVRVDPANYQLTLVTVPRDTVLPGESSKINDTLVHGDPMQTVDAVECLTGIEVDYYLMTTFTAFEDLVDALGGVTVDVPKTVKVPDPSTAENVTVTKGDNQTLDGSEALVFARARKEYVNDQDAVRQMNVRQLEQNIICNVLGMSSESEIDQALIDLRNNTTSNMDMGKLGYLAMVFAMHETMSCCIPARVPILAMSTAAACGWLTPIRRHGGSLWTSCLPVAIRPASLPSRPCRSAGPHIRLW